MCISSFGTKSSVVVCRVPTTVSVIGVELSKMINEQLERKKKLTTCPNDDHDIHIIWAWNKTKKILLSIQTMMLCHFCHCLSRRLGLVEAKMRIRVDFNEFRNAKFNIVFGWCTWNLFRVGQNIVQSRTTKGCLFFKPINATCQTSLVASKCKNIID